jgi:copper chaperone
LPQGWESSILNLTARTACILPSQLSSMNTGEIMAEFTLSIDGMHCGACVRRVSQALAAEGLAVKEVRVGAARVASDQSPLPIGRALAAVEKAGYRANLDSSNEVNTAQAGQ